ncbi:alpha/beta fold hydrolase [Candidatus Microgenomates bacterium]|nr:alpha/beta fold hydrolase [Candidatus Microgenomates bacterium]
MNCELSNVVTKDGVNLQGLLFTPTLSTDTVGILIHGLGSNFYGGYTRLTTLARYFMRNKLALATFNTRGHDVVTFATKQDKRKQKGYRGIRVGAAFEKFTDSVLDLEAIVEVLGKRYSNVVLIGHSTGANKVVYYLSRRNVQKKIAGAILISPVSDVPMVQERLGGDLEEALNVARKMVKSGKSSELVKQILPQSIYSAQRLVSLGDQRSIEQMFPTKEFQGPLRLVKKIKIPILVLFGDKDDYLRVDGVSVNVLLDAFRSNTESRSFSTHVMPQADHSFSGKEEELAQNLVEWIKKNN